MEIEEKSRDTRKFTELKTTCANYLVVILVPLVPPSCNHYVRHTRAGNHYVIPEARAFKDAVAIFAQGSSIQAKAYAVTIDIYLAAGQRLDLDNSCKLTLDGIVAAHVIDSDAKVVDLHLRKHRDPGNPRTEIVVSEVQA